MRIGNLGNMIIFAVSSRSIVTFQNFTQTVKGRWATHAHIGMKPSSEFLGADLRSGSLNIFLSSMHGVKPRTTIGRIERAIESGTPFVFVVGRKRVGNHKWVIASMSEKWGTIIEDGRLVSANVELTLQEYI